MGSALFIKVVIGQPSSQQAPNHSILALSLHKSGQRAKIIKESVIFFFSRKAQPVPPSAIFREMIYAA